MKKHPPGVNRILIDLENRLKIQSFSYVKAKSSMTSLLLFDIICDVYFGYVGHDMIMPGQIVTY